MQCTESAKKAEPGRTPATLRLSTQCKAAGHDCCGYVEDLARLHSVLGPFGVKPCGFSTSHVSRFVELGDGKSDCRLVKAATKRSRAVSRDLASARRSREELQRRVANLEESGNAIQWLHSVQLKSH